MSLFQNNNPSSGMFNQNTGGNAFNTGGGLFNNANTGGNTSNIFGNNQPAKGGPFGGGNTSLFGGNANQGQGMSNNMFGGSNNTSGSLFNNPGNTGGGLFTGSNTAGGSGNLFGGNTTNQGNQGGNMFNMGNNTGGGNSLFNNVSNALFGGNTMGSNQMGNNQMGYNTTGGGSFMGNPMVGGSQVMSEQLAFQTSLENTKMQLEECLRRMASRNLQTIRLDNWNVYKDKPLNKLPFKDEAIRIMLNFNQLKKATEGLKKTSQEIQNKMSNLSKQTHKKLSLYKKCLLQTVSHTKLIEEVSNELDMINKEMEEYFKPLYNAYKEKKKILVKEPNEFDLKISYDVLNKLQILDQRVDEMIACENPPSEEEVESTITVFEQLIQYYQNVSCSFNRFSYRYNELKKKAIERERRGSYQAVMSKVVEKAEENLKKQFKYYDLIKEIDDLLAEKEKREEKKRLESQNRFDTLSSRKTYF